MTEEKKLNGYDIIQQILPQVSSLYSYMLGLGLVPPAIDVARDRIGTKSNSECQTTYTEHHYEPFIWALGLICLEWIMEDLRRKAEEGHCHTHKKELGRPCEKGSEFHKALYEECKKSFEDVLKNSRPPGQ